MVHTVYARMLYLLHSYNITNFIIIVHKERTIIKEYDGDDRHDKFGRSCNIDRYT